MAKRLLKLNDAFESYLNRLIRDMNISFSDLKDEKVINNLGKIIEITLGEIFNIVEINKSKIQFNEAVRESLKKRFFYEQPRYDENDLNRIDNMFKILNSFHNHQQRTLEWYKFRWERLTASDLSKAIGEKGEKSRWELVYQKSMSLEQYIKSRESFSLSGQPAIAHGISFEPIATSLYENKNNLKVDEYGCLPHQTINFLAASPDGICNSRYTNPNYHGRMLEIKCPYSRVITGIPKTEYYMQVQLQLEVCNLEYCDFLECDIRTYQGMTDFLADSPNNEASYSYTRNGNRKGVIYEYTEKGLNNIKYKYCPFDYEDDEVSQWISNTKREVNSNIAYSGLGCKYWWIEEYNTTLLKRDQEYFNNLKQKLEDFWQLVLYYRKNGTEELEQRLGLRPKPPTQIELILVNDYSNNYNYKSINNNLNNKQNSNTNNKQNKNKRTFPSFEELDFIDIENVKDDNKDEDIDFIDITENEEENTNINKNNKKNINSINVIKPE
jgi:putative phage-type endonuclease